MTDKQKLTQVVQEALRYQSVEEMVNHLLECGVTFRGRTPIETLDLSLRSYNALKRAKIDTVEELRETDERGLRRIRGLGEVRLKEILRKLEEIKQ